jgi:cysteine desulfurase
MRAYLDHAAASPIDPRVRASMLPFLESRFGSPASLHAWGRAPADALARARADVAALIGADPEEVVFTSGATEARNLAVKGIVAANPGLGGHVVASAVEHAAVVAAARAAGEVTLAGVDGDGRVLPSALAAAMREDTVLVCVPHAQADLGTVQDVPRLVDAVRARRPEALVHVDAGASAGRLPIEVARMGCDALSLEGGPMGGPGWAGALWVRAGVAIAPILVGGLQEWGLRAGPEAVPGIVGLGAAARLASAELPARAERLHALDRRLRAGLLSVPDVRLNGPSDDRLPGHVQVSAGWVEAETLTLALAARGVAASPGTACTAEARKAAPVLEAIGLEPPWTHSAVLFTLGHESTEADVDVAVAAFAEAVAALREMSPLAPPAPSRG